MTAQLTETSGREESNGRSKSGLAISAIKKRGQNGSLAILLGAATLLGALARTELSKTRQLAKVMAGGTLFAIGVRQLQSERTADSSDADVETPSTRNGETEVSDDAHSEAEQDLGAERNADETQNVYQPEAEPNPRGMTDRSDVEEDQEGDIHFVEGEQPGEHRETHLEDADAHDTRLHPDSDGDPTEVDLSEAAMADEASEAAGPHTEQSYPAREGTDPEPTSEKAPERVGEGAVAPADSGAEVEQETDNREDDDREKTPE